MISTKNQRILRVLVGILWIAIVGGVFHSWWALLGLVPLIVGISGFCPLCYFKGKCSIK
ncbi:MAG: DUF2892 domain-containing protein [Campylobacter sp.]|nr:DUF2892 domain-containing protein [Campylobacter sp.]